MTDPRPDFDTETFTPYELFIQNNFKFGFLMKSWGQPFYSGSIVKVYGWLRFVAVPIQNNRMIYKPFPSQEREEFVHPQSGSLVLSNEFVCSRNLRETKEFLIIENVGGKGWLPEKNTSSH